MWYASRYRDYLKKPPYSFLSKTGFRNRCASPFCIDGRDGVIAEFLAGSEIAAGGSNGGFQKKVAR